MNKSFIPIIISMVVVAVVAMTGYVVWNASNVPSQVGVQQNPNTTPTQNPQPTPQPGKPIVQTNSNTAPYISTVVVTGTVNPNGAVTRYWYEYGETTTLGAKTSMYLVGSGYTTIYTPAYITGLRSNTDYYFRLGAENTFGTVIGATYAFRTNATPVPTGTAPTTTTNVATDVTRTSANIHGKINPKGSETTFWFEYGLTAELGAVTAFQSAGSGNASLPFSVSISNLQPVTKYYFRLNAQNQFGTINGEILNFTTKGPAAPSAPTVTTNSATAVTDSSAKLNGDVRANGAMTIYWFEYSTNASLSNALINSIEVPLNDGTIAINISASINNLDDQTKYYFRVVAKNQYGTSRGNIESFTTKK